MTIAIGCDHGGYALKETLKAYLTERGQAVTDLGCCDTSSVDYPDYGFAVGEAVAAGKAERGIVICTTGVGISIAANKVKGVRCALCTNETMARYCRLHNDANVLALGANITTAPMAKELCNIFLETAFEGGRHARRVNKINAYDEKRG